MTGEAEQLFIDAYERQRAALPGAGIGWLSQRRDEALRVFRTAGLPHRRLEDWRYTDLRQALGRASLAPAPEHRGAVLLPAAEARPSAAAFNAIDRHVFVFVNGRLRADLSDAALPSGVEVMPLADALDKSWVRLLVETSAATTGATNVIALNTALMQGGVAIHVHKGVRLEKPLHLLFLAADDGAFHARNFIRLDEGASASILETHVSAGASRYFADLVTDVSLADGASLDHVKVQDEAPDAIHLATLSAHLDARSKLSTFSMTLGSGVSRSQSFIRFEGEEAKAEVNGATALRGSQHGDHFVLVDHAVPHCTSGTLFRSVLDGTSTGVFQGRVVVREGAQKSDGRQMTNALLLSRDAAMNAKPELEIYADDVQCAHGSTIGELSAQAIFYLRSRGIDEATARQLLISAFLDEAFESVPHEAAREALRALAAGWFQPGSEVAS